MKQLIVAESQPIAEEIASAIANGKFASKKNYLENTTHVVTWCPDLELKEQREKETKHQFGVLKALYVRHDICEIVNACPAGSKCDMVFDLIHQHLQLYKSYKRLWITSYERSVIKEGMANLLDDDITSHLIAT